MNLSKQTEELISGTKSLILSIKAHPDWTGEEDEWLDLVSIAEEVVKGENK